MNLEIAPVDTGLDAALWHKVNGKTKPPGSLGRLESLAWQIGRVRGSLSPVLQQPHMVVFAADHGAAGADAGGVDASGVVVGGGISAYPQEVTWQMVENFLAGGAAINVFARANGLGLTIVDAGVAHDFGVRDGLVDAKVGAGGTASYLTGAAMSAAQCQLALQRGGQIVNALADSGCDVVGFGEMGIGNTASAALITHCLTDAPLRDCVGRGTGLDDAGLARKTALLEQALAAWPAHAEAADALQVLARFGGFEIAMMAGAMIAAAQRHLLVLVDGFICGAAALVVARLAPAFLDYAVFCHASAEAGHRTQLQALGVEPLVALDLRLGEGTGAALVWPLVRAACAFLTEMASFDSAGVSKKN